MTATIPPSPTVGDVITTAGELDGLPVGSVVLGGVSRASQKGDASVPGWWRSGEMMMKSGRTAERVLRYGPATLLHRPDAPPAAPTAGVDREALARAIDPAIYPDMNHVTGDGWQACLRAADAVLAFLASQPTPAPVDADAVERAECDHEAVQLVPRCADCGEYADVEGDVLDPDDAVWLAENADAALAAARAGEPVTVTAEQVDALRTRITDPTWRGESVAAQVEGILHALDLRVQR